ncbi:HD domain-containing protein [Streptomyces sp. NPDC101209]|uniref:HD domain-containing protein n=1 Tax=Streptomyces sp. NPDC101209 TaxID=3366129 RepID=UPI003827383E
MPATLAGVHDIGKATPAFACQVEQSAQVMRSHGADMRSRQATGANRRLTPHGWPGSPTEGAARLDEGQASWAVQGGGGWALRCAGPRDGQMLAYRH